MATIPEAQGVSADADGIVGADRYLLDPCRSRMTSRLHYKPEANQQSHAAILQLLTLVALHRSSKLRYLATPRYLSTRWT